MTMARTQTVSVTVRLPIGIVEILNDAVDKGMFVSTSDAIRALVRRSIQDAGPELGRGTAVKRTRKAERIMINAPHDEQEEDDAEDTVLDEEEGKDQEAQQE